MYHAGFAFYTEYCRTLKKLTLKDLIKHIESLIEFGNNPNVKRENKVLELKKILIGIYAEYVNLKPEFDEKEYPPEPNFNYQEIRKNLSANFPDFGLYHIAYDCHLIEKDADLVMGDAMDDLTDIIRDMLSVKWKYENTSIADAKWEFDFSMSIHSESHLVNFLKYLKEKAS